MKYSQIYGCFFVILCMVHQSFQAAAKNKAPDFPVFSFNIIVLGHKKTAPNNIFELGRCASLGNISEAAYASAVENAIDSIREILMKEDSSEQGIPVGLRFYKMFFRCKNNDDTLYIPGEPLLGAMYTPFTLLASQQTKQAKQKMLDGMQAVLDKSPEEAKGYFNKVKNEEELAAVYKKQREALVDSAYQQKLNVADKISVEQQEKKKAAAAE